MFVCRTHGPQGSVPYNHNDTLSRTGKSTPLHVVTAAREGPLTRSCPATTVAFSQAVGQVTETPGLPMQEIKCQTVI